MQENSNEFLKFKDYYRDQLISTLKSIDNTIIDKVIDLAEKSIRAKKNTIYIFGNGGSHSIARHFGISLSDSLKDFGHSIRINYGIDFHTSQAHSSEGSYKNIFTETLQTEKADNEDLVVLISGSGDSDNILQTANYCIKYKIPCVSFSGFSGGKIARKKIYATIIASVNDQQICEDVNQALLHIIVESIIKKLKNHPFQLGDLINNYALSLKQSFSEASGEFLSSLSQSVTNAFLNNKTVFVLGPEGHGLSVSAEHIAHNFNWDAVFQIKTPPKRNIVSSPSYADFSGVGNDRLIPGIVMIQQLDKAVVGDVVLFFIYDINNSAVKLAIKKALDHQMNIFVISSSKNENFQDINYCHIKSKDKFVTADATQSLGHITARLIRYQLKLSLKEIDSTKDVFSYLVEEDMAQRRLLDKPSL